MELTALLGLLLGVPSLPPAQGQDEGPGEAESANEARAAERFLAVLERSPRRGVPLDKVYEYHLERGSLNELLKSFAERARRDPKDGTAWMLIGLLESKQGRDAEAIDALARAAELRPQDPLAPYYLGQCYTAAGQTDRAAEAYEAGIARKPPRREALDLFQALGRLHLRAGHPRQALEAWTRLEQLVPDETDVQEEIAATLVEEGELALALPRYQALARGTKEESRRAEYRIEIAEILSRQNQTKEAIAEFDSLLATLNPEGWLYRDIRTKVEQTFLRSSDLDGLTRYYTAWIGSHPEDVDAMARLARLLVRQARTPEARVWLEKALKLAPSRGDLRRVLIEQLVDDQRYPDALAQYQALDRIEPGNPDTLREWGKLILRDRSRPRDEREREAEAVWRRLLAAHPTDALTAVQVADLLRHAEMMDAAEALYRKGVELAPDEPQYREYLGEFHHLRKRPEQALATWKEIAAGSRRSAAALARLAEVLASFGYLAEAIPPIEEACTLEPRELALRLKAAQLQAKGEKLEAALASLSAAEPLAQNDEEQEAVLAAQLDLYEREESLDRRASLLTKEIADGQGTARKSYFVARLREAQRKWSDALLAIEAARQAEPKSLPILTASARIAEQAGRLDDAVERRRRLADLDRRGRGDHLRRIAELELQLGHKPQALQAARELVASAPGNTENQEFLAQLCFRIGDLEEGLQILRRAIRLNPDEPRLRLTLAGTLADRFRTQEAIAIYWQAFDKGSQLDDKLAVILKLTELSVRTTSVDRLLERLQGLRRAASDKRELTLCIAQAHQAAGDVPLARRELEGLMEESTRDTPLLQQLSKLAESDGDLRTAIDYQRRLVKLAPGPDTEFRLATLLSRSGRTEESSEIFVRLAGAEPDSEQLLKVLDTLLAQQQHATARAILAARRNRDEPNWELLYREGMALSPIDPEEAGRRFEALLALSLSDDEPGIVAKNRLRRSPGGSGPAAAPLAASPFGFYMTTNQIRQSLQMGPVAGNPRAAQYWTPTDFGEARMASIGWLFEFSRRSNRGAEFLLRFREPAERDDATERQLWDYAYLSAVTTGTIERQITPLSRRLARSSRIAGSLVFLQQVYLSQTRTPSGENSVLLAPEDLALASEALRKLARAGREAGRPPVPGVFASLVLRGLAERGKRREAVELFGEMVDLASTPSDVAALIAAYPPQGETETLLTGFDKFADVAAATPGTAAAYSQMVVPRLSAQLQWVATGGRDAEAFTILDRYLDFQRQRTPAAQRPATASRTAAARGSGTFQVVNGVMVQVSPPPETSRQFPPANSVLDDGAVSLLQAAHTAYRRGSRDEVLRQHLQSRLKLAEEADRAMEHFALACLHKWSGSEQASQDALLQAMQSAPRNMELWLDVVRIHVQASEWKEAAMLIEQISPAEIDQTRERELLALEIASRLGETEMGRKAADRLSGMRLDLPTELLLATHMRRLGMEEAADTVLARSREKAGNQAEVLTTLMQTAATQGNLNLAEEIALQILQGAPAGSPSPRPVLRSGAVSGTVRQLPRTQDPRADAMAFLTKSGRLNSLIARAEAQLERSPNVPQRYEELAELYQLSRQPEKAREVYRRLVALNPEDITLLTRLAPILQRAGQLSEACDTYLLLLRKNPSRIHALRVEILDCFQKGNRNADLVTFLESMDPAQLGGVPATETLIRALVTARDMRPAAVTLLRKSWSDTSDQRASLLTAFIGQVDLWKTDEFLDYGTLAVIPTEAEAAANPWFGLSQMTSAGSDGQTFSLFQTLISGTLVTGRVDALRKAVADGIGGAPSWRAGPLIVAVLDGLGGRLDAAGATIEKVTAATGRDAIPPGPAWLAGYVLEQNDGARALAVPLYCVSIERLQTSENRWRTGPGARMLKLLDALDRRQEIREILLREAGLSTGAAGDPNSPVRSLSAGVAAAQQMENFKLPFEAWQVYLSVLVRTTEQPAIGQPTSVNQAWRQQARHRLGTLTTMLAKTHSAELLRELLPPEGTKRDPAIDLMLIFEQGPGGETVIASPWTEVLAARASLPAMVEKDRQRFADLIARHPGELEPRILAALHALASRDPEPIGAALRDLRTFVEAIPGPAAPEKEKGTADPEREPELRRQLGLWMVAGEALSHEEAREQGRWFAARAIAAARQLPSGFETRVMLERGIELALAGNLRDDLERFLRLQLEIAAVRPISREPSGGRPAPLALTQYQLAMRSLVLAVDNDFPDLAGVALRECFIGGMPVPDTVTAARSPTSTPTLPQVAGPFGAAAVPVVSPTSSVALRTAATRSAMGNAELGEDSLQRAVRIQILELSRVWRQKGLPPGAFYDALHLLVFDQANRRKLVLHEDPSADAADPQSLGRELARWAIRAGRADALDAELAALGDNSDSALPALSLRTMQAIEARDHERAAELLADLAGRLAKPDIAELAIGLQPAGMAYSDERLRSAALPILEVSARRFSQRQTLSGRGTVRLLADHYAALGMRTELMELLDSYVKLRESFQSWSNSGTDPLQRNTLREVLEYAGSIGDAEWTLERLWQYYDLPAPESSARLGIRNSRVVDVPASEEGHRLDSVPYLWHVARQLASRPAVDRYHALRDWVLPSSRFRGVREIQGFTAGDDAAQETPLPHASGSFGTLPMLVAAARDADRLADLRKAIAAAPAPAASAAGSAAALECLTRLVAIAEGDAAPAEAAITAIEKSETRMAPLREYLIAEAALAHDAPAVRDAGRRLGTLLLRDRRTGNDVRGAHLQRLLAFDMIHDLPPEEQLRLVSPNWKHWTAGPAATDRALGHPAAWWAAEGERLVHLTGGNSDALTFRWPVTGTFRFSFEAPASTAPPPIACYGRLLDVLTSGTAPEVRLAFGPSRQIEPADLLPDGWIRYSVKVTPESIRYFSGDRLLYEDRRSHEGAPWLSLHVPDHRRLTIRRLTWSGQPTIPREIPLLSGIEGRNSELVGWIIDPPTQVVMQLASRQPPTSAAGAPVRSPLPLPLPSTESAGPVAWHFAEGELRGPVIPRTLSVAARGTAILTGNSVGTGSQILSSRPLQSGESATYEFFFAPGESEVHPIVGPWILELKPEGIRAVRWALRRSERQGIVVDRTPFQADRERSGGKIAMKPDAWNTARIELSDGKVRLIVNGDLVDERPMERREEASFGFFYDCHHVQARVRNVVLTGGWPQEFGDVSATLLEQEAEAPLTPAQREARDSLLR